MFLHALRIVIVCCLLPSAWAANSLALILSEDSPPYREFVTTLHQNLSAAWKITLVGKAEQIDPTHPPDLMVTLGTEALRQTLARPTTAPIIATLVSRSSFEKTLQEKPAGGGPDRTRITAIYLEQPIQRQITFIRQLLPNMQRIGMLHSPESRFALQHVRQALHSTGMSLDSEETDSSDNLLPALNALLPRVGVLLATPDSTIYRRDNIKSILLTSYRYQKPVIAFSAALVNAGAMAAVYSSPAQIAQQTGELIQAHGLALFTPEYPKQFSIAINRSVADALGFSFAHENELRRALSMAKDLK